MCKRKIILTFWNILAQMDTIQAPPPPPPPDLGISKKVKKVEFSNRIQKYRQKCAILLFYRYIEFEENVIGLHVYKRDKYAVNNNTACTENHFKIYNTGYFERWICITLVILNGGYVCHYITRPLCV